MLVKNLSETEFQEFVDREYGYRIQSVPRDKFEPYTGSLQTTDTIYTAVRDWILSEANTTEEYQELCESAAAQLGNTFRDDFNKSTYKYYSTQEQYTACLSATGNSGEYQFKIQETEDIRSIVLEVLQYTELSYLPKKSSWEDGQLIFEH